MMIMMITDDDNDDMAVIDCIFSGSSENIKPYEYVPFFFLIKMFYVIMLQ